MELYNEKNKLPLTIKYMESFREQTNKTHNEYKVRYVKCKKYQTDFLIREKPFKALTRLL